MKFQFINKKYKYYSYPCGTYSLQIILSWLYHSSMRFIFQLAQKSNSLSNFEPKAVKIGNPLMGQIGLTQPCILLFPSQTQTMCEDDCGLRSASAPPQGTTRNIGAVKIRQHDNGCRYSSPIASKIPSQRLVAPRPCGISPSFEPGGLTFLEPLMTQLTIFFY